MSKNTNYHKKTFSEEMLNIMSIVNSFHENYLSKRTNKDLGRRLGMMYPYDEDRKIEKLLEYFSQQENCSSINEICSLLKQVREIISLREYVDFSMRERDTYTFIKLNTAILRWSKGK